MNTIELLQRLILANPFLASEMKYLPTLRGCASLDMDLKVGVMDEGMLSGVRHLKRPFRLEGMEIKIEGVSDLVLLVGDIVMVCSVVCTHL